MPAQIITDLDSLGAIQKEEMVASLAILLIGSGEVTAEKVQAIAEAAGCTVSSTIATLFSTVASKCPGGPIKYRLPPGGGGGGGGGGGAAAAGGADSDAAAAAEEKPEEKEEEEEMDLGGGMDMFGGGDAGGGGGGDY